MGKQHQAEQPAPQTFDHAELEQTGGISLAEYYAGHVIAGLLASNPNSGGSTDPRALAKTAANIATALADEMERRRG